MPTEREKITILIGERIRKYRIQQKLSQEALAFASEIHPAYLGRLERGEKCPTIDTLYKISKGLKIPLSQLLDITEEIKPSHYEAINRIETAVNGLTEQEAVEIADIVERIIAFKKTSL